MKIARTRFLAAFAALAMTAVPLVSAPALSGSAHAIVGGSKVGDIANVPYAVALLNPLEPQPMKAFYCGGVIVAPQWVLSARHCLSYEGGGDLSVDRFPPDIVAGVLDLRTTTQQQRVRGDYVVLSRDIDLGLVHLSRPLPAAWVVPMNANAAVPARGDDLRAFGWGETSTNGPGSPILKRAPQKALGKPANCGPLRYDGTYNAANFICAGSPPDGAPATCYGDSGGPLVTHGATQQLVGIVSFGTRHRCTGPGTPTMFVRVSQFLPWIRGVIAPATTTNVSVAPLTTAVEGQALQVKLTLNRPLPFDVPIRWHAYSGTALAEGCPNVIPPGLDAYPCAGDVVIRAGTTSTTALVITKNDTAKEPAEWLIVGIISTNIAVARSAGFAVINDND